VDSMRVLSFRSRCSSSRFFSTTSLTWQLFI
jgi:hypothetical protein